jgi:DNA-binding MarR family transcriptional regulator
MADITNKEKEILRILFKRGALTPIELSVEQLEMPDKIGQLIAKLEKKGYISKKPLKSGLENEVITISEKGMRVLKE